MRVRKAAVQQEQLPAGQADQRAHEDEVRGPAGPDVGGRVVQHGRHGGDRGSDGEEPAARSGGPQRTGAGPDAGRSRHEQHVARGVGPHLVDRAVQQVRRVAGQEQQQGQAPPAAVGGTRPPVGDEVEEQQQCQVDHGQRHAKRRCVQQHVVTPRSTIDGPISIDPASQLTSVWHPGNQTMMTVHDVTAAASAGPGRRRAPVEPLRRSRAKEPPGGMPAVGHHIHQRRRDGQFSRGNSSPSVTQGRAQGGPRRSACGQSAAPQAQRAARRPWQSPTADRKRTKIGSGPGRRPCNRIFASRVPPACPPWCRRHLRETSPPEAPPREGSLRRCGRRPRRRTSAWPRPTRPRRAGRC